MFNILLDVVYDFRQFLIGFAVKIDFCLTVSPILRFRQSLIDDHWTILDFVFETSSVKMLGRRCFFSNHSALIDLTSVLTLNPRIRVDV